MTISTMKAKSGKPPALPTPPVSNVLGVGISAVTIPQAVAIIDNWLQRGEPNYVCLRDVNGVVASQDNPELRRIHNRAGLVTPDGMPLVWLSRLNGHRFVQRVYGPDLMLALCELAAQRGYRNFLYGGLPGVADQLSQNLQKRFPGLQVVGTYSPPFGQINAEEDQAIVERIKSSGAEIVWVGISSPKQEFWMASHLGNLGSAVMLGVGAAFDFHSGRKRQAPRWLQHTGFEWLFRLITEPRRLGPRYLSVVPRFLWLISLQLLGLRKFPLE
jgi:N-acetylglucosaminyldiphosphoundecaprenol N-acetyl-beta-D-mannosaminyltransferase